MLQTYITQVQRLTRDTQGLFTPLPQLIDYINEARVDVASDSGCILRLVSGTPPQGAAAQPGSFIPGGAMPGSNPGSLFQTIIGVERYPYIGFANPFVSDPSNGIKGIIDTVSVSVNWGGTFTPSLDWMPWEEFQAWCRVNTSAVAAYPTVFSVANDGSAGEVWLFPKPQAQTDMEWYVFCEPLDIYADSDPEALPRSFQTAVQYRAAAKIYQSSNRMAMAAAMMQQYLQKLGSRRVSVDRGKIPTHYPAF